MGADSADSDKKEVPWLPLVKDAAPELPGPQMRYCQAPQ
jgi:hypothetical protein